MKCHHLHETRLGIPLAVNCHYFPGDRENGAATLSRNAMQWGYWFGAR